MLRPPWILEHGEEDTIWLQCQIGSNRKKKKNICAPVDARSQTFRSIKVGMARS